MKTVQIRIFLVDKDTGAEEKIVDRPMTIKAKNIENLPVVIEEGDSVILTYHLDMKMEKGGSVTIYEDG